jgi:hypothetical protein
MSKAAIAVCLLAIIVVAANAQVRHQQCISPSPAFCLGVWRRCAAAKHLLPVWMQHVNARQMLDSTAEQQLQAEAR